MHFLLVATVIEVAAEFAFAGVEGFVQNDAWADAAGCRTPWIIFTIGACPKASRAAAIPIGDGRIADKQAGPRRPAGASLAVGGVRLRIGPSVGRSRRAPRDRQSDEGHNETTHEAWSVPQRLMRAARWRDFQRRISLDVDVLNGKKAPMDTIGPNAFAILEYRLEDDDGELIDSSDGEESGPIEYVHGYGQIVPGLEKALDGKKVGDSFTVVVEPEEGFGDRDEEAVFQIDRSELPDDVEVGDEFVAEGPDGEEELLAVVELGDDFAIVDANHELAGVRLTYKVKVLEVRAATDEEVEEAASEFDELRDETLSPEEKNPAGLVDLGAKKKKN